MTRYTAGSPWYSNSWYCRPVIAANSSMTFWVMSAQAKFLNSAISVDKIAFQTETKPR